MASELNLFAHVPVSYLAEYLFPGLDHTTHEHPCHKWQQGYQIQCLCVSPSDSDWYMCINAVAGSAKCTVLHCDPCDHHMLLQHSVYGVSSKGMKWILADIFNNLYMIFISSIVLFPLFWTPADSWYPYIYYIQIIIIRMGPDPAFLSRRFHLTQWNSELEKESGQDNDERNIMEQDDTGASDFVTDMTQNISLSLETLQSENLHLSQHINEVRSVLHVHLFTLYFITMKGRQNQWVLNVNPIKPIQTSIQKR